MDVNRKKITPEEIGIDLYSKNGPELFKWLLLCLLRQYLDRAEDAKRIYEAILLDGLKSPEVILVTGWERLSYLIEEVDVSQPYFDPNSLGSRIIEVCWEMIHSFNKLDVLLNESNSRSDAERKLGQIKSLHPNAVAEFLREVTPVWFPLDYYGKDEYEIAREAASIINNAGFEAYVVGGAVRDLLLGKLPKDYDLATNARPEQIINLKGFESAKFKDTAQAYGVTRIILHGYQLEIATFRKDIEAHLGRKQTKIEYSSLQEDLMRRDLTINAIALDPLTGQLVEFENGLSDIRNKLIRFIGNAQQRINEDPLRVLRAIRFKNRLEFQYDKGTERAIKKAVKQGVVGSIATDRLRQELTSMLLHQTRSYSIMDLDRFGILEQILPEVSSGKGVEQPQQFHAEGDVWTHQLLILELLPKHPSTSLVWAALLHDIGKKPTQTLPITKTDRIRFNEHYKVGAEMARTILKRLNFSKPLIENATWVIYHHMNIDDLPMMRPSLQKSIMGHPSFVDLLEMHRADAAASMRPGRRNPIPSFHNIERLWHEYLMQPPHKRQPSLKTDLGIDGKWLLEKYGKSYKLQPGKRLGDLLSRLQQEYMDTGIKDVAYYERLAEIFLKRSI